MDLVTLSLREMELLEQHLPALAARLLREQWQDACAMDIATIAKLLQRIQAAK